MAVMGEYEDVSVRENIRLRLSREDIMSIWKRCGMTADYGADYVSTYFGGIKEIGNSASTIMNELIENAAKYSSESGGEIEIKVLVMDNEVIFQVNNFVDAEKFYSFREFVERVLESDDVNALYFDRLASLNEGDQEKSGIGLLSIISFFNLKFGLKFKSVDSSSHYMVSVQAAMPVKR